MINSREELFTKAMHDCYVELYAKAQPPADYDNLCEEKKQGKINEKTEGAIHDRHFLSEDELNYIVDKYINIYKLSDNWHENVDLVQQYLKEGGIKYVSSNDNETKHSDYEKVTSLKNNILDIIKDYYIGYDKTQNEISDKIVNKVFELIDECKRFYKFNLELDRFKFNIYLGAAPSSDEETVKKWWKDNYNIDIEIEKRIPELFWYYDNGYTDEDLEHEFEHLGPNWKDILRKKHENRQ